MNGTLRYAPGSGVLLVGATAFVYVDDSQRPLDTRSVDVLYGLVQCADAVPRILDVLLHQGFSAMPPTLLGEFTDSEVRLVLRGLAVTVRAGDTDAALSALGISTLQEHLVRSPQQVTFGSPAGMTLPLAAGVVRAGGFVVAMEAHRSEFAVDTLSDSDALEMSVDAGERAWLPLSAESSSEQPALPSVLRTPQTFAHPSSDHDAGGAGSSTVVGPSPTSPPAPIPAGTQASAPASDPTVDSSPEAVPTPDISVPIASTPWKPVLAALYETRVDEGEDDAYSHLFEETVFRSVEDAAVRGPVDQTPVGMVTEVPGRPRTATPAPDPGGLAGDHDGHTVMASSLAGLLPPKPSVSAPVDAVRLRLRMSTGQLVVVDRAVVVGRKPTVSRVSGSAMPELVVVASQDISRSHIEFRPAVGAILAVDLHSTNGSTVTLPSGEQHRLFDGGELRLHEGARVDLGDGVLIDVERFS